MRPFSHRRKDSTQCSTSQPRNFSAVFIALLPKALTLGANRQSESRWWCGTLECQATRCGQSFCERAATVETVCRIPNRSQTMITQASHQFTKCKDGSSRILESEHSFSIGNIRGWTESTPAIDAACEHAAMACNAFARYCEIYWRARCSVFRL